MKTPWMSPWMVGLLVACVNAETIAYIPQDGGGDDATVFYPTDVPTTDGDAGPPNEQNDALADGTSDGVTSGDAGPAMDVPQDVADSASPPGTVVCLGTMCAAGDGCCLTTGHCYNPTDAGSCPVPSRAVDPLACASNADCAATEYCGLSVTHATGPSCTGIGTCLPRAASCPRISPIVCGCDGATYGNACLASSAGVRAIRAAPCGTQVYPDTHNEFYDLPCDAGTMACDTPGFYCDLATVRCRPMRTVIACGFDSQCPTGQVCCGVLGICLDPSRAGLCTVPPPMTSLPCRTDADCWVLNSQGEDAITNNYCDGPGGCGAIGGCRTPPTCSSGILTPTCGCDGNTYVNPCAASTALVRVAHDGGCP